MRIVVDHGSYRLHNIGDTAMLAVAVRRLRALWPDARIQVLTANAQALHDLCPSAEPLAIQGRQRWLTGPWLPTQIRRRVPWRQTVDGALPRFARRSLPAVVAPLVRSGIADSSGASIAWFDAFQDALRNADLYVVAGGGVVTDAFAQHAMTLLEMVESFGRRGAVTAMLGHGLGPVAEPRLEAALRRALPWLDLLTVREERASVPLLNRLGAGPRTVRVTGDDAIELAQEHAAESRGHALGVNLRIARYANMTAQDGVMLRATLNRLRFELATDLIPVPISLASEDSDVAALQGLCDAASTAPADCADMGAFLPTLLQRISSCRAVVTGSYHAALFSLSQGVPVVGLANTPYYEEKFLGLAQQFGGGVRLVRLGRDSASADLVTAVLEAWEQPAAERAALRLAGARQVEAGRTAYAMLRQMVDSRRAA